MRGQVLKISSSGSVGSVYMAILKCLRQEGIVHLECIGVKASYIAVKSLIMAIDELSAEGYKTNLRPRYITVKVENPVDSTKDKTAIRFTLISKKYSSKKRDSLKCIV